MNTFFKKSKQELFIKRNELITLLKIKGFTINYILGILEAFDYFIENPDNFDGATAVQDLYDFDILDLKALVHDYLFDRYNCGASFSYRKKADKLYAKMHDNFHNGDLEKITRYIGLQLIAKPHLIITVIKRGFMKKDQKEKMDLYLEKFK